VAVSVGVVVPTAGTSSLPLALAGWAASESVAVAGALVCAGAVEVAGAGSAGAAAAGAGVAGCDGATVAAGGSTGASAGAAVGFSGLSSIDSPLSSDAVLSKSSGLTIATTGCAAFASGFMGD
jgi:hypothetical protein